jgi:flagellar motor switch protein FliN/FliY
MTPSSPYDSGAGTMDLLMDMELPVMVRFGSTRMLLRDLLKLTAGSIIEFSRSQENPVEILVNRRVVARGSAIVVEGNYGVRIGEVAPDAAPVGGREN